MFLIKTYDSQMTMIKPPLEALKNAFYVLEKSTKLRNIFSVILRLGNYMNGGSSRGGISGFKIDTLDKVREVRSSKSNSITLLHFIVQTMQEFYPKDWDITEESATFETSTKADLDTIANNIKAVQLNFNKCQSYMEQAEKGVIDGDLFHPKFSEFSTGKEQELTKLKEECDKVAERANNIINLYGESPQKMKLADFLNTFNTFTTEYMKAAEDIAKQKAAKAAMKEKREKRREQSNSILKKGHLDQVMSALEDGSGLNQMKAPKKFGRVTPGKPQMMAPVSDLQAAFLKVRAKK